MAWPRFSKGNYRGPRGFEKTVAVKKILPEFGEDEDFVQMFVDEARISSHLHHPNIVQVYDFGQSENSYYLSMEFVDGANLRNLSQKILKNGRKLSSNMILFVGLQVAKALAYAHAVRIEGEDILNLVHRDISPQNILISRDGMVKLTDFGIAKATIKLSKTQPGKVQGKLSYMSPEQATGQKIDRRSDIFSLGIILYELITSTKAYSGDHTGQKYSKIRHANIPNIQEKVPELSDEVAGLITSMLSKNPDDRPSNSQVIVENLSEILENNTVEKLETELAELVSEFFPREKSDSGVPKFDDSENSVVREAPNFEDSFTEVRGDYVHQTDFDQHTKSVTNKNTFTFQKIIGQLPVSPKMALLISGGFILLTVFAFLFFWPSQESKQPEMTEKKVPEKSSPTENVKTVTQMSETEISSGPVDLDLRQEALDRQKEVELKLKRLEAQVLIAEEKAAQTEKELKATKEQLKKATLVKKKPCPRGMVHVQKGEFYLGSSPEDPDRNDVVEPRISLVKQEAFCIDIYEYPNRRGGIPKTLVTWKKASSLCKSKGKRLCSKNEWERSCKGSAIVSGRSKIYPYGNKWQEDACNVRNINELDPRKIQNSGSYPDCVSSEGIIDMSGNVDEWTASRGAFSPNSYVTKGGSSYQPGYQSRCASIREIPQQVEKEELGFRCCKDVRL